MPHRRRLWKLQAWFLINVVLYCCSVMACSFDIISESISDIPQTSVTYENDRIKRETDQYFRPIQIHIYFGLMESNIQQETLESLRSIVRKAVDRISQLLHVVPVHGPLLLQRHACKSNWLQGENKGRCASIRSGYKGEFCENKIDLFQIPANHLTGLDVFNITGSVPVYSLPAGQGISDTDYIIYVSSRLSDWCQVQDVHAYASYCRLDQNFRPIAGFINFCPNHLQSDSFNGKYFLNVAVHELFHALGFSKDLFVKYQGCSLGSSICSRKKKVVIKDSFKKHRLIFPSVIHQMQNHFKCQNPSFGAPLETKTDGLFGSHWDPLLMYGSIMTPNMEEVFDMETKRTFLAWQVAYMDDLSQILPTKLDYNSLHKPEFMSVDPITLSVFADTGWYKVNFSEADNYLWGKGDGCNFGLGRNCQTSKNYPHLCDLNDQNNSSSGCDYLQYTKASCHSIGSQHYCGFFKPDLKYDCRQENLPENLDRSTHESRCFLIKNQSEGEIGPTCAAFHCTSQSALEVLLGDSWITCSNSSEVKAKNVTLFCPQENSVCYDAADEFSSELFPWQDMNGDIDPNNFIGIRIYFDRPKPMELLKISTFERFKTATLYAISKQIPVPLSWMDNTILTVYKQIILDIYFFPPTNKSYSHQIQVFVVNAENFIRSKTFAFIYKDAMEIPVVSSEMMINPDVEMRMYDHRGYALAGIIIIAFIAMYLLASCISSVLKIRKRRKPPKRQESISVFYNV